jgi:hypothetical protein
MVLGKMVPLLVASAAGALAVSQWPDIRRYIKIKQMSTGDGHPENVPVKGTAAYRQPGPR